MGDPVLRASHRNIFCSALLILSVSSPTFALHTRTRYHRSIRTRAIKRTVRWAPTPLKGSHESLVRQNEEIDRLQLGRIADDAELQQLIESKNLVSLPSNQYVKVDPRLDDNRRFCRPWTRDFLNDIGEAYYKQFKQPLQVNSAVRTVSQQEKLIRHNGNAAPAEGPTASSHLAGLTVDIAKHGMTGKQRKWMQDYLLKLRDQQLVEAAEERKQAVFHVMVSERYAAYHGNDSVATRDKSLAAD